MDKPANMSDTPAIRLVEKPKSTWTGVLNGAGNGAMVGGTALIAHNIYDHFKEGGQKPSKAYIGAMICTGIGTVIGAFYGLHEAKQATAWRSALAKDIETLHAQIDGMDPKISR